MAWWVPLIAAVGSGAVAGSSTSRATRQSAGGIQRATEYEREQFDITQEQLEPYREIGLSGLQNYEEMLGEYQDREGDIRSDVLGAYQSGTDIPESERYDVGDYEGVIQSGIPEDFSYDGFENDPGRLAAIQGGQGAVRERMGAGGLEGMDEMSSNLASRQYGAAVGRAAEEHGIGAQRSQDTYLRGIDEYSRLTGRNRELYGRERAGYQDALQREQELESRAYRDYTTQTAEQEEQYRGDLAEYGRNYIDPMSEQARIAGIGQSTTTGLGQMRQSYADRVNQGTVDAARVRASGQLAQAGAVTQAAGALGSYYRDQRRT